jgi:UDP-N-acetylmuramoyl-tripeptide--D-alanyl-D-alanine ligase
MSAPGEIGRLSRIAQPNLGVVTNVKPAHLEFFSSLSGIARAKRELIENLPPQGVAFLNNDDAHVRKFSRYFNGKVVTFGVERLAAYRVHQIRCQGLSGCEFRVRHNGLSYRLASPLLGPHNVANCLSGIALAHHLDLSFEDIAGRLRSLQAGQGRGRPVYFEDGFCVIDDSYNSNPAALMTMMRLLKAIPGYHRKILVAGEMLEMGADSARFHEACGKRAAGWRFDLIIGIQGLASRIVASARALGYDDNHSVFFDDANQAGQWLASRVRAGDLILVKGSRGVKTEGVIQTLRKDFALTS